MKCNKTIVYTELIKKCFHFYVLSKNENLVHLISFSKIYICFFLHDLLILKVVCMSSKEMEMVENPQPLHKNTFHVSSSTGAYAPTIIQSRLNELCGEIHGFTVRIHFNEKVACYSRSSILSSLSNFEW